MSVDAQRNEPGPARSVSGIFDRSTLGAAFTKTEVTLERGAIAFFARVVGETNPVHFDVDAARTAGHPDIVAPATYAAVINMTANENLKRRGQANLMDLIGCDYARLLHGEESYTYFGLAYAGDVLTIAGAVEGFQDKKGGAIEVAKLRYEISHAERGLLIVIQSSAIHRLA